MKRRLAIFLLLMCAIPLTTSQSARAEFGFAPGGVSFRLLDHEGNPDNRAGAHPDKLEVEFAFNTQGESAEGAAKSLVVELPPGLLGTANATPTCSREIFDGKGLFGGEECPKKSRVGTLNLKIVEFGEQALPLFNVEPAPEEFATFGTNELGKIAMRVRLRPGDLGATIETDGLVQNLPVIGGQIELWGIPADHQQETSIPRRPLLVTPTQCDVPPAITLRANSWEQQAAWDTATVVAGSPLEGCGALPFDPSTAIQFDNAVTDAPSGTTVNVTLPQDESADGRVSSEIRALTLRFPEGVSLSPPGANGLVACTDAQLGLGHETPATCPGASRVGSVEFASPLLLEPLTGSVYIGEESGAERFRIFIVAAAAGIEAKFAGTMELDPNTGRISTHLDDLPEIPFSRIGLSFDGGPYALLATPTRCGSASIETSFDAYARAGATSHSAVVVFSGGPHSCGALPFRPSFLAGSATSRAGQYAEFSTFVERRDGDQQLGQLTMEFPAGLTAALRAVSECPALLAEAGACPDSSRIGSSVVQLGPGPNPVPLSGDAYFTEPFKGDPYGMTLVFHGRIGPFDVGSVVVRAGLEIDPQTGRLTVETEKLPQIKDGIPLRFRAMEIDIDRARFMRNPTSCTPKVVEATMRSSSGAEARVTSPFRVRSCHSLKFRPRVSMSASEGPATAPRKPSLRIRLRRLAGGSNLKGMSMLLPQTFGFDFAGLRELCSHRQAAAEKCRQASAVGSATARTPLLERSLKGPIFVAQPDDDGLPEFWISLRGANGIRFGMRAKTAMRHGELKTVLKQIPDVPLSRLSLRFASGENGVITSRSSLCGKAHSETMQGKSFLEAQNYALRVVRRPVVVEGCRVK